MISASDVSVSIKIIPLLTLLIISTFKPPYLKNDRITKIFWWSKWQERRKRKKKERLKKEKRKVEKARKMDVDVADVAYLII